MNTKFDRDPHLTVATLINRVVCDMLHRNEFAYSHFPELVDLAVVGTGLGLLQSNFGFVSKSGSFWDSTRWEFVPRPFLDTPALAYTSALAAWARDEKDPEWVDDLPGEAKRPMRKSLKFLQKTGDSFFQTQTGAAKLNGSQHDWAQAASGSTSSQIISLRHLKFGKGHETNLKILLEQLRSGNPAVLLHAITAAERMKSGHDEVNEELRVLAVHRDDQIRAKAMIALTRVGAVDEPTVDVAVSMLDSNARFVVFAGMSALASLDSVPEHVMPPVDRGFGRSLQTCNYELAGVYVTAYNRWLDDPAGHFENLLRNDSPEFAEIAQELLRNCREQTVALG